MDTQNFSFVVRVWFENTCGDGEVAICRGSIEQVGSNSRTYFSDLDGITRFIQSQIHLNVPAPPSKWQSGLELMQNGFQKFWKHLRSK